MSRPQDITHEAQKMKPFCVNNIPKMHCKTGSCEMFFVCFVFLFPWPLLRVRGRTGRDYSWEDWGGRGKRNGKPFMRGVGILTIIVPFSGCWCHSGEVQQTSPHNCCNWRAESQILSILHSAVPMPGLMGAWESQHQTVCCHPFQAS